MQAPAGEMIGDTARTFRVPMMVLWLLPPARNGVDRSRVGPMIFGRNARTTCRVRGQLAAWEDHHSHATNVIRSMCLHAALVNRALPDENPDPLAAVCGFPVPFLLISEIFRAGAMEALWPEPRDQLRTRVQYRCLLRERETNPARPLASRATDDV